jgi:hypothetical protein
LSGAIPPPIPPHVLAKKNLFSGSAQPPMTPVEKLTAEFASSLIEDAGRDRSARDALKSFLQSDIGQSRPFTNITMAANSNAIDLGPAIRCTSNVMAGSYRNLSSANPNIPILSQQIAAIPQAPGVALKNGEESIAYVNTAAAGAVSPASGIPAAFLQQRSNSGVYTIQPLRLPREMSLPFIIKNFMADQAITINPTQLKELTNAYRKSVNDILNGGSDNQFITNNLLTRFNAILAPKAVTIEFLNRLSANDNSIRTQILSEFTGVPVPSPEYLKYADAQIQLFLAQAGSNNKVNILPTNDPLMAAAYSFAAQARNLSFINYSDYPGASYILSVQQKAAIGTQIGIPVNKNGVLEKLDIYLGDLGGEVAKTPASNNAQAKLTALRADYNNDGVVSFKEVFEIADSVAKPGPAIAPGPHL